MLPPLAIVVVLGLAAFRITRICTTDTISDPIRERFYRWAWDEENPQIIGERPNQQIAPRPRAAWRTWLYELATCQWCLGVWWSVAVYCAWRWGGDVALSILAVLAIAGAQGMIARFSVRDED